MLAEELNKLIDNMIVYGCETQHIELKSAERGIPEKLYDTLSGFANQSGGGIIIFGVREKPTIAVVGVYDAQDIQTKVTNYSLQMEPVIRPVFTVSEYEGKTVVSAEIPECDVNDKPCFYTGTGRVRGSFIRVGEADLHMTEYEIYSYEAYKKKIRDELRIVERAEVSDFSKQALAEYFVNIRRNKTQLANLEEETILKLQGMTNNGKPTVAGVMLLCDYPQAYFPQLSITAMVVNGTEIGTPASDGTRFIDDKRFDGSIPNMLTEAMSFVRRNTRSATVINDDGEREDRSEYPMKAVREVILNALIHRDYSSMTEDSPIRVLLFDDRLEVENPGGLYGRLTVADLGNVPADTRNPFIAGNLEVMMHTENRFSGIPTIRAEMANAGLKPPVFESKRGNFKAILFNSKVEAEPIANGEVALLAFLTTPKTRDEIAEFLKVKSPYYAMKKYVRPLIECGKIRLLLPNTPNSKLQRFVAESEEFDQ